MMCCPLSGHDDGDHPECFSSEDRKAGKDHQCRECYETIPRGAVHEVHKGMWDGRWDTIRTCLSCREIRAHFACGKGWLYGSLWEDLEENFFPDMTAGGRCMDGLSPAAKARLFEERMKWFFEQSEYGGKVGLPPSVSSYQAPLRSPDDGRTRIAAWPRGYDEGARGYDEDDMYEQADR